jgi:RNA polymerase sigma-70 factor (ECF subfamily)
VHLHATTFAENVRRAPTVPSGMTAEALFRAHAAFVAKFVTRLGVARESVDDVVQEVFLAVHRRGGYVEGTAKPTTWLAEFALRVVSTHKRGDRRRRVTSDEGAVGSAVSTETGPEELVAHRAVLDRVQPLWTAGPSWTQNAAR